MPRITPESLTRTLYMPKLSQIKGVIFDLDGVLVDTEGLHYSIWLKILGPFGISFSKREFFNFMGRQVSSSEPQRFS